MGSFRLVILLAWFAAPISACSIMTPLPLGELHPLESSVPSLRNYYDEALTKAKSWQEDAYLYLAEAAASSDKWVLVYHFNSPSAPHEVFLVEIEVEGNRSALSTFDYFIEGGRPLDPPISMDEIMLDSTDVAGLALLNGGKEFIAMHPEAQDVLIQLVGLSGYAADELGLELKRPVWRVSISHVLVSTIDLVFDPDTGEFLGSIIQEQPNG